VVERDEEFRAFVVGSTRRLTHFAELLTADRGRAEDLVQEAYLRTYRAWGRVEIRGAESYTRRCILNARTDWWRRSSSRERLTAPNDLLGSHAPDHGSGVDQRLLVMTALAKLTTRERAVIALRFYLGLSEPEIAADLGVAVGTVKSTKARALAKLRADPTIDQEAPRATHR
jgi:RNA polymerase sigma-70 factor (sigma-E family)